MESMRSPLGSVWIRDETAQSEHMCNKTKYYSIRGVIGDEEESTHIHISNI